LYLWVRYPILALIKQEIKFVLFLSPILHGGNIFLENRVLRRIFVPNRDDITG
jgi:hypothetical protein